MASLKIKTVPPKTGMRKLLKELVQAQEKSQPLCIVIDSRKRGSSVFLFDSTTQRVYLAKYVKANKTSLAWIVNWKHFLQLWEKKTGRARTAENALANLLVDAFDIDPHEPLEAYLYVEPLLEDILRAANFPDVAKILSRLS